MRVPRPAPTLQAKGAENGAGSCFLHHTRYDFNDDILPLGAALHAGRVAQSMPLSAQR